MKLRPEVQWFAEQMERKLRANDHKGGWQDDTELALLIRLLEETSEVLAKLRTWRGARAHLKKASALLIDAAIELDEARGFGAAKPKRGYIGELADVANFAMMLADNARTEKRS